MLKHTHFSLWFVLVAIASTSSFLQAQNLLESYVDLGANEYLAKGVSTPKASPEVFVQGDYEYMILPLKPLSPQSVGRIFKIIIDSPVGLDEVVLAEMKQLSGQTIGTILQRWPINPRMSSLKLSPEANVLVIMAPHALLQKNKPLSVGKINYLQGFDKRIKLTEVVEEFKALIPEKEDYNLATKVLTEAEKKEKRIRSIMYATPDAEDQIKSMVTSLMASPYDCPKPFVDRYVMQRFASAMYKILELHKTFKTAPFYQASVKGKKFLLCGYEDHDKKIVKKLSEREKAESYIESLDLIKFPYPNEIRVDGARMLPMDKKPFGYYQDMNAEELAAYNSPKLDADEKQKYLDRFLGLQSMTMFFGTPFMTKTTLKGKPMDHIILYFERAGNVGLIIQQE
jgi:hypothetical protein